MRRDRCVRSRRGSLPHSAVGCKLCVRACVPCASVQKIGRGGSCGGGFPAGGAGGAGRRTVASLPSVAIASSGAAVPAAVAGSTAPVWRGCDQSDRWRRKRRARGERGVGAGAPASLLEHLLPPQPGPGGFRFLNVPSFFPISPDQRRAVWRVTRA